MYWDYEDANSTEFDRSTAHPVIDLMLEQRAITDMGGTMRLGLYPCVLQPERKLQQPMAKSRLRNVIAIAGNSIIPIGKISRKRDGFLWDFPGWLVGGNCRTKGSSLHGWQPIPP